jgi:hypothetical protein
MLTGHNPIIVIKDKDSRHGKPGEESFPLEVRGDLRVRGLTRAYGAPIH